MTQFCGRPFDPFIAPWPVEFAARPTADNPEPGPVRIPKGTTLYRSPVGDNGTVRVGIEVQSRDILPENGRGKKYLAYLDNLVAPPATLVSQGRVQADVEAACRRCAGGPPRLTASDRLRPDDTTDRPPTPGGLGGRGGFTDDPTNDPTPDDSDTPPPGDPIAEPIKLGGFWNTCDAVIDKIKEDSDGEPWRTTGAMRYMTPFPEEQQLCLSCPWISNRVRIEWSTTPPPHGDAWLEWQPPGGLPQTNQLEPGPGDGCRWMSQRVIDVPFGLPNILGVLHGCNQDGCELVMPWLFNPGGIRDAVYTSWVARIVEDPVAITTIEFGIVKDAFAGGINHGSSPQACVFDVPAGAAYIYYLRNVAPNEGYWNLLWFDVGLLWENIDCNSPATHNLQLSLAQAIPLQQFQTQCNFSQQSDDYWWGSSSSTFGSLFPPNDGNPEIAAALPLTIKVEGF